MGVSVVDRGEKCVLPACGIKKKTPGVYNGGFLKKSFDNIRFRWIARFTGGTVQGTHQTVKIPTRTKCEDISGRLKKKV